jgi:hypothetical protein
MLPSLLPIQSFLPKYTRSGTVPQPPSTRSQFSSYTKQRINEEERKHANTEETAGAASAVLTAAEE